MEVYSPWMFKYIVAARDWPHLRLRGISAHINTLIHYSSLKLLFSYLAFQGSTLAVFRYPEHPRFSDGIPDLPAQ